MVPIFKPYMPSAVLPELSDNLYSGSLAYGKVGKEFESKMGCYIGNEKFLSTSSYNYAFLIAISTLNLQPGDEIIASPMSCLASNQPFVIKNLKVKWVDIDPKTGAVCLDDLKKKISNQTKAVFINHYCGYLANQKEIFEIVKRYNIPLVDDAIESFGSKYENRYIGNHYADITIFSFQTVRLPNTIEGGGISFFSNELYSKALKIRDYGIDRAIFRDELNEISAECDIILEGYGALMPEFNSIIGSKQMLDIDNLLLRQKYNSIAWDKKIKDYDSLNSLVVNDLVEPNYWIYGLLADNKVEAIKFFRSVGFYATGVHINNNIYSVFGNKESLKGVNEFYNKFIALPCGWWVEPNQISEI